MLEVQGAALRDKIKERLIVKPFQFGEIHPSPARVTREGRVANLAAGAKREAAP
jgi:hypothetical protein